MTTPTLPYAPQKLILINAGNYDYAEVELSGSLQIVGPNNAGKTTLINTLQFLYIDDHRQMSFGSHSYEQTCNYYFPNQYGYVLFQSLGARGTFVLGWRGQSKVSGGEPIRFHYQGAFDPADFLEEGGRVREPTDVNDRLGLKSYTVLKSDSEHREILLLQTKGEPQGAGLVALQHSNQYPQFRETLKNLLCLSTITQDQMRDRLLMLAGLPTGKHAHALDVRKLFGEDYERLITRKQALKAFKEVQAEIELLVKDHATRERLRGELMFLWSHLRTKHAEFVQTHDAEIKALETQKQNAVTAAREAKDRIQKLHQDIEKLSEVKGALDTKLEEIAKLSDAFKEFEVGLTAAALATIRLEIRRLEKQLEGAASETLERADAKIRWYRGQVDQKHATIAHFDHALITELRRTLNDDVLEPLARLFNFQLLHQPIGINGIDLRNREEFIRLLRTLSQRIQGGVYRDSTVELPLPESNHSLAELADLESVRTQLEEDQRSLQNWVQMQEVITKQKTLEDELKQRRTLETELSNRLLDWERLQRMKEEETRLRSDLEKTMSSIETSKKSIEVLSGQCQQYEKTRVAAENGIRDEKQRFSEVMNKYAQCNFAYFNVNIVAPAETPPDKFDAVVTVYLNRQKELAELDGRLTGTLRVVESALSDGFTGSDEAESIQNLREQLDALPEREETLRRDWELLFHELRATFADVLRGLDDIKSAADRLKRAFSHVQVSNLRALSMDVVEQVDIVGSLRKLAKFEQPGLFDESPATEATIGGFRQKFQDNPHLRYVDLFTLRFTVTGADGKLHHYQDFKQIESHGTSITIKVLFNLLVLRGLLRESSSKMLFCEVPFFLDEIHSLDAANRHAVLMMARELGFIAITAAPESVSEVDALYFLQPKHGRIVLRRRHRMGVNLKAVVAP